MNKKFKVDRLTQRYLDIMFKDYSNSENALEKFIMTVVMNRDAQYAERGKRPDLTKVLELDAKELGIEMVNTCANCNGMSKCHK